MTSGQRELGSGSPRQRSAALEGGLYEAVYGCVEYVVRRKARLQSSGGREKFVCDLGEPFGIERELLVGGNHCCPPNLGRSFQNGLFICDIGSISGFAAGRTAVARVVAFREEWFLAAGAGLDADTRQLLIALVERDSSPVSAAVVILGSQRLDSADDGRDITGAELPSSLNEFGCQDGGLEFLVLKQLASRPSTHGRDLHAATTHTERLNAERVDDLLGRATTRCEPARERPSLGIGAS